MSTAVNWPAGVGGKGNEGVAGLVSQTPGSIGYVELIYALQNKIAFGSVQNANGEFVKATTDSVTAAAAAAAAQMPADFRVSITNAAGRGRLSRLVVHLAAALRESEGQGAVEGDGGLPEVGADRRAAVREPAWLCAASCGRGEAGARGARAGEGRLMSSGLSVKQGQTSESQGSRRSGSARACSVLLLILIVAAIGFELARQSMLSIQKFGLQFWRTSTWDPVAGEFGALPFIWGTLYSSVLALLIATPVAIGIAVFITELCPPWLRQPLVFLTELLAAIPSIVYGLWGIFVLVPAVRAFQVALPDSLQATPDLQRAHRSASACCRRR